jgi:membrane dipeptidase
MNKDYMSLTDTPAIWDGMRKRGYGEDAIEKTMRGNWLRVLKDVWGK